MIPWQDPMIVDYLWPVREARPAVSPETLAEVKAMALAAGPIALVLPKAPQLDDPVIASLLARDRAAREAEARELAAWDRAVARPPIGTVADEDAIPF